MYGAQFKDVVNTYEVIPTANVFTFPLPFPVAGTGVSELETGRGVLDSVHLRGSYFGTDALVNDDNVTGDLDPLRVIVWAYRANLPSTPSSIDHVISKGAQTNHRWFDYRQLDTSSRDDILIISDDVYDIVREICIASTTPEPPPADSTISYSNRVRRWCNFAVDINTKIPIDLQDESGWLLQAALVIHPFTTVHYFSYRSRIRFHALGHPPRVPSPQFFPSPPSPPPLSPDYHPVSKRPRRGASPRSKRRAFSRSPSPPVRRRHRYRSPSPPPFDPSYGEPREPRRKKLNF